MPRGRHRHSPPLHRLLPTVAVAVVALACAGAAWLVGEKGLADTETVVLRGLVALAAVTTVVAAVLLRRRDHAAGRRVGDLKAQQASTAWRAEEKQAELESEAEELREIRTRLDTKLREKRTELAGLRSEHADLLRRYAHAETERASALEGRRQLEIEAAEPTKALAASATDHRHSSGAPTPLTYLQASEALKSLGRNAARQDAARRERVREEESVRDRLAAERRARTSAASAVPPAPRAAEPDGVAADTGSFDFFGVENDPVSP